LLNAYLADDPALRLETTTRMPNTRGRQLARCCRSAVLQQVGSYLAYIGRGANPFERAAHDPKLTSSSQVIPDGFEPSYWIERREQALLVADWQFHATSDDVCDPAGIASSLDDNVCDQVWIRNLA